MIVFTGKGIDGKNTARGLEQKGYELDVSNHNGTKNVANAQRPVGPNNGKIDDYSRAADKELDSGNTKLRGQH